MCPSLPGWLQTPIQPPSVLLGDHPWTEWPWLEAGGGTLRCQRARRLTGRVLQPDACGPAAAASPASPVCPARGSLLALLPTCPLPSALAHQARPCSGQTGEATGCTFPPEAHCRFPPCPPTADHPGRVSHRPGRPCLPSSQHRTAPHGRQECGPFTEQSPAANTLSVPPLLWDRILPSAQS